ncbi:MAG: hypothetical protein HY743_12990 [Deltaproteobacteria bacterium]|nr:hypothetical protein [Deltaproteobacteria bacterium]
MRLRDLTWTLVWSRNGGASNRKANMFLSGKEWMLTDARLKRETADLEAHIVINAEHEGQASSGVILLNNPDNLKPLYKMLKGCIGLPLVEVGNLEIEV